MASVTKVRHAIRVLHLLAALGGAFEMERRAAAALQLGKQRA
jgi:hypothetical protein